MLIVANLLAVLLGLVCLVRLVALLRSPPVPPKPFDFDVLNNPPQQPPQQVVHIHHYHEPKKGWYQGPVGSVVRILIVLFLVLIVLFCLI